MEKILVMKLYVLVLLVWGYVGLPLAIAFSKKFEDGWVLCIR